MPPYPSHYVSKGVRGAGGSGTITTGDARGAIPTALGTQCVGLVLLLFWRCGFREYCTECAKSGNSVSLGFGCAEI